ncbi:MAG: hypothetical protein F6K00_33630 [Leptolyngbya sp. SIOISBB]|nr:hypothetical protein [Leptolyngbya sp. SIOISBB]
MTLFDHKLIRRLLRLLLIATAVISLTFLGLLGEIRTAIAQQDLSEFQQLQEVAGELPAYESLGTQTFGSLSTSRDGSIPNLPEDIAAELGFDTGRSWSAGTPLSDVIRLGDLGNSFYPQALSIGDIGRATGVDPSNFALSNYDSLLSRQSLGSLANLTGIQDFKLNEVAPVQRIFDSVVRPELLQIAGQIGDLKFDEFLSPEDYVTSELLKFGERTIGDIISAPDLLSGTGVFGDINLSDAPAGILEEFGVGDLPGFENIPLGELEGWQDLVLSQVPGLSEVPFGDFPNPIAAITGGIGATHDVTYGHMEHRVTPTKRSITGSDQAGFNVQCAQERGCAYLELEGPGPMHGAQWMAGGNGQGQQMVEGGKGLLKIVNGGKEPTGRVPFGDVFKIVLTGTNESGGSGDFALYTRYCQKSFFVDLGCTPYFIGPVPLWSTKEKGFVLTGPLEGKGGATGGIAVPPELQQFATRTGGGSYYGAGGGSAIQMDDACLDSLIGALRHSNEAANAREHIPRIIAAANEAGVTDKAQIAYILGTISTELEGIWAPTGERGVGCGTYGAGCFYGRGYVQLTWEENYAKMGRVLGVDLVNNPDLANDPDLSAKITVIGMRDGLFTGVGLDDYIGNGNADFINARRIVNDGDKMEFTAQQAERFLTALNTCSTLETTTGVPAGDINAAIMEGVRLVQAEGFSGSRIPGTNNGNYACAGMVNYVLHRAGIATLGGAPPYGSLGVLAVESDIKNGRGVAVNPAEAQPGDINIIDDYSGRGRGHIGICINVGCTRVISNSSSRANAGAPSLTWESDGWFSPSYGRSSTTRRAVYRVTN